LRSQVILGCIQIFETIVVLQDKHNGETMSAAYPVVARSAVLVGLQWIGLVLGGSLAVMFVWLLAYLAIDGRQNVNDAIGQEQSNAIEQENSALCSRFGITVARSSTSRARRRWITFASTNGSVRPTTA